MKKWIIISLIIFGIVLVGGIIMLSSSAVLEKIKPIFLNGRVSAVGEEAIKERTFEYTPSTDKVCIDGKCTLTLYSGTRNVYEDEEWKRVEDARSLKGSGIECVVNSDGENLVECVDWNMTSITLSLSQKEVSLTNKEVPIKIYSYNDSGDLNLKSETKESFSSLSNEKEIVLNNFRMGDIVHFGDKSTEIILQDNETENLEDACFYDGSSWGGGVYIKFDISTIPLDLTIEEATLNIYVSAYNFGSGTSLDNDTTFKRLDNQSWTEDGDINVTFFSGFNGSITNEQFINSTGWKTSSNIQSLFEYDYNVSNSNFTIYLYDPDFSPSSGNFHIYTAGSETILRIGHIWGIASTRKEHDFYSKEYATDISLRPYLNITYSEAEDVYYLNITSPTTSSPASVSAYDNISINFNFLSGDNNITSGVEINNVTIGGEFAEIVVSEGGGSPTEIDFETFDTGTDLQPVVTDWYTYYAVDSGCVWWKDSDGTVSTSTGPCAGASNCAGNDAGYDDNTYAYVETSSANCNTGNAHAYLQLNDTNMDTYSDVNFSFAWNMYGANIGNLSVQINDGVGGWKTLWSLTGNQGTAWGVASVDLSAYSGERDIRFDYDRNGQTSYLGDVAVDVLNVTNFPTSSKEFVYIDGIGWQVNVTVPAGLSGLQDLFLNATYNGFTRNDTQTEAINYEGGAQCSPTLNQDWTITDTQVCNGVQVTTGTGMCSVSATGFLYLINGANVSCNGLDVSVSGEHVFINKGCELRVT